MPHRIISDSATWPNENQSPPDLFPKASNGHGESETILNRVRQILRECRYHELSKIDCEFHEGAVSLKGSVSSFFVKQMAQTAVSRIEGVEVIVTRLKVRYPEEDHGGRSG